MEIMKIYNGKNAAHVLLLNEERELVLLQTLANSNNKVVNVVLLARSKYTVHQAKISEDI